MQMSQTEKCITYFCSDIKKQWKLIDTEILLLKIVIIYILVTRKSKLHVWQL